MKIKKTFNVTTVCRRLMSYPICIKRSSKAKVSSFHSIHQRDGVSQVGLWRSATKILQGHTVDSRVSWGPQLITEDPTYIRAHHYNTSWEEKRILTEQFGACAGGWWIVSPPFMASMCIFSWSGPVSRLLMALKSKMFRSSCRYTSTESTISTENTEERRLVLAVCLHSFVH